MPSHTLGSTGMRVGSNGNSRLRGPEREGGERGRGARGLTVVDPGLKIPLYHQIYVLLREQILSGVYGDRALVPTELTLARTHGVSRITAKRALDELKAEGLVERRRGRGTSVAPRIESRPVSANLGGLIENLLMMGLETAVEILEFDYVAAPDPVQRALELPVGAEVQRAVRVRRYNGVPLSHTVSYVPAVLGRSYAREDLAKAPLLALLERAGCLIGSAEQTITATLADAAVAPRLAVQVGAPLLSIARTVCDQTGRPVEHIAILYRPDRYAYQMKLTRVQGDATKLWSPAE